MRRPGKSLNVRYGVCSISLKATGLILIMLEKLTHYPVQKLIVLTWPAQLLSRKHCFASTFTKNMYRNSMNVNVYLKVTLLVKKLGSAAVIYLNACAC